MKKTKISKEIVLKITMSMTLGHRGSKREQPCLYMIDVKRRKSKMGFDNRYVER